MQFSKRANLQSVRIGHQYAYIFLMFTNGLKAFKTKTSPCGRFDTFLMYMPQIIKTLKYVDVFGEVPAQKNENFRFRSTIWSIW